MAINQIYDCAVIHSKVERKITEFTEKNTEGKKLSLIPVNLIELYDVMTSKCQFFVSEPPTPPHDLQLDTVSSNKAKLSWRDTSFHVQYYTMQYTANEFLMWDSAKVINTSRLVGGNAIKKQLQTKNFFSLYSAFRKEGGTESLCHQPAYPKTKNCLTYRRYLILNPSL